MASILNDFMSWRKISIFFLSETSRPPKFLKKFWQANRFAIFYYFPYIPNRQNTPSYNDIFSFHSLSTILAFLGLLHIILPAMNTGVGGGWVQPRTKGRADLGRSTGENRRHAAAGATW